jgi:glucokinase
LIPCGGIEVTAVMKAARSPTPEPLSVGIDLGGAGVRIVTVNRCGTVRARQTFLLPQAVTGDDAAGMLVDHVRAMAGVHDVSALGVGASTADEPLLESLRYRVSDSLGVSCHVEDRVLTTAVGEYVHGAGDGAASMMLVDLGTTVGIATIVGGRPPRTVNDRPSPSSHFPVADYHAPCPCGLATCWSELASRTMLDALAIGRVTDCAARALMGSEADERIFDHYGMGVGAGLAVLLPLVRPELLVIGGTAARHFELFAPGMDRTLVRRTDYSWHPQIRVATLGALSSAIGAAALAANSDLPQPSTTHQGIEAAI